MAKKATKSAPSAPVQTAPEVQTGERPRLFDKMNIEGPITLMAFPPADPTKPHELPKHPAKDDKGRRIVNVYELLLHNVSNRYWNEGLSKQYAETMVRGQWDTECPVIIYRDWYGDVHNGQHISNALIMAEAERTKPGNEDYYAQQFGTVGPIAISAGYVTGINPDSADFLDIGKQRQHKDVMFRKHLYDDVTVDKTNAEGQAVKVPLSLSQQQTIATWTATAAKIIWLRLWFGEKVRSSRKFPHAAMNEVLKRYPQLEESAKLVYEQNEASAGGVNKCLPPAYAIALHFLAWFSDAEMTGSFKEHADYLIDVLANGAVAEPGAPFYELREYLTTTRHVTGNEELNRKYDAVVYAWNQYLDQKPVTTESGRGRFKVFNGLKKDAYYEMGGLDTRPEPVVKAPATVAAEKAEQEAKAKAKAEKEAAAAATAGQNAKAESATPATAAPARRMAQRPAMPTPAAN